MPRGTVKWYDPEKGYGLLTPEQGDKDLVFKTDQVQGDPSRLGAGTPVDYTLKDPRRGIQVDSVSVIEA